MDIEIENDHTIPIVGIGASAGGLEALKALLSAMPFETGAAYVVVQHLAPDQKSILHELLQAVTPHTVMQIQDHEIIKPEIVYIVPPGKVAAVDGDMLVLSDRDSAECQHRPIDVFLSSLALARGRDAYCVILSGTDSDGSAGLTKIKAAGGFAFAQESKSARFPGMPDSAVATGLVDFVLPAGRIAAQIGEVLNYRRNVIGVKGNETLQKEIIEALPIISDLLLRRVGIDYSNYKSGTIVRRIERRMSILRANSVKDFIKMIDNDKEAGLLSQEFMIGVTRFFRDEEAFNALNESVVKPLLDKVKGTIRIWVPGCSTGQEAYTLAMMFLREVESRGSAQQVQVFGTDIDTTSLNVARYGAFSADAVSMLPEDYLAEFFISDSGQYKVKQSLRDACVFTPHNILQDPPFSRLDMISCRNLMIYLSSRSQETIIAKFHFAIRDSGFLFLGSTENPSGDDGLFIPVDKIFRIFKKNDSKKHIYSSLVNGSVNKVSGASRFQYQLPELQMTSSLSKEFRVERDFIRYFAAPFAQISETGNVLYLSQKMTSFVQPAQGAPSATIDTYLAQELRVPVRSALAEAVAEKKTARRENIMMVRNTEPLIFDITVGPCEDDFILSLSEVRASNTADLVKSVSGTKDRERRNLENENVLLRRQLAETLQDSESSSQDLKSVNEELMSMNEELQSSNEELETSREELQSINEELVTVNAELHDNNSLLIRANSDLKNLFDATDIAVLFLDKEFCIRSFTPSTRELFGIRSRDVGRPVTDLASSISYNTLVVDARSVSESLQPIERELTIPVTNETFLVRIKPYRTTDNRLDGYALSFINITQRKLFEQQLKEHEEIQAKQYAELLNLYDKTPIGLSLIDRNYRWIRINETLAQITGFTVEEHIGKTFNELLPDLEDILGAVCEEVFSTGKAVLNYEITGSTSARLSEVRHWIADFYPVSDEGGTFAVGSCIRDVTEQVHALEQQQRQSELQKVLVAELQHRVKNTLAIIGSISKLLLAGAKNAADFQARLTDRILAISRTHDTLTVSNWRTAKFSEIIKNESAPFFQKEEQRIRLSGVELELNAEQALSVGMCVHELVTNAAKYGALSTSTGAVYVTTALTKKGRAQVATIEWHEYDGPKILSAPQHSGFGTMLMERVFSDDLSAKVSLLYPEEGLKFRAEFKLPLIKHEADQP